MIDPGGISASHYNPLGNITREERTIKGVTYTTEYRYDREGVLKGLTYPGGRSVDYKFDDARRVRRVTTTRKEVKKTVAKDISYLPFGPLKDLTYGNGITLSQGFDLWYQLQTLQAGDVINLEYERDGVGNIEAITDHLDPTRSQGFHYDALDRLENAYGIYGTIGYSYDDVGNRLTKTAGKETDTYVYVPDTNRLKTVTGAHPISFEYDTNGNTKSMGAMKFRYDQNDRLIKAIAEKSVLGRYTYNGRGQRTVKKTENGMTIYHYDLWGHLITETKKNGKTLCEYLYLDDRLLAMAPKGRSRLLFAHTDHLGTPLKMTDKKGIVVWQADYRPFGETVVDEDPDGDGKKFIMNLRFPGQYFDEESGLYYNYYRYYQPQIGRYTRPDPIGVMLGELNPFSYALANPIGMLDPFGLITIDGMECTEKKRSILPGYSSGVPIDSFVAGERVICTDIVIEDPFTCACIGQWQRVIIDVYKRFISYEVTYTCCPKNQCGENCKDVIRIETVEPGVFRTERYEWLPERGSVVRHGFTFASLKACSACPGGVGSPM